MQECGRGVAEKALYSQEGIGWGRGASRSGKRPTHTHLVSQSVTNTWPGAQCILHQARLEKTFVLERKTNFTQ